MAPQIYFVKKMQVKLETVVYYLEANMQ